MRGEMPHWRPVSVESLPARFDFGMVLAKLLLGATTNPALFTVNPVVLVPVTLYSEGSKLNMLPYFSVRPPW